MTSKTGSVGAFLGQQGPRLLVKSKMHLAGEAKINVTTVVWWLIFRTGHKKVVHLPAGADFFFKLLPTLTLGSAQRQKYAGYNDTAVPPTHICAGYMYP